MKAGGGGQMTTSPSSTFLCFYQAQPKLGSSSSSLATSAADAISIQSSSATFKVRTLGWETHGISATIRRGPTKPSRSTSSDTDVINTFICGTTCEALINALGCETPGTMRELLDVATKYTTGEEVVQANFSGKAKVVGHLSGGDSVNNPTSSQRCHDRRDKDQKRYGKDMVATADRTTRPQPHGHAAHLEHFEEVLESPCSFHGGKQSILSRTVLP